MQNGWLKRQLTKSKQNSPLWADFCDALQTLISNHAEEYLTRLKSRTSLFDQSRQDLDILVRELGDFFALGKVTDDNLPIVIMQRQDQIHLKLTIYPLINTLIREFNGISVTWQPLYAPTDQEKHPYGSLLVIESEISDYVNIADWFMTSRGVIRVPINDIRDKFSTAAGGSESAIESFETLLKRVIYPLIPLRIVCDGQQYFLHFDLIEIKEIISLAESNVFDLPKVIIEYVDSIDTNSSIQTNFDMSNSVRDPYPTHSSYRMDAFACDAMTIDEKY